MNWLYIFVGGGLGACCRWMLSQLIHPIQGFPTATFTVNMAGCLLIGALSFYMLEQGDKWPLLVLVGFLGGFTTFSTYGLELLNLLQTGKIRVLITYILLSNLFGILFVILGHKLSNYIFNP